MHPIERLRYVARADEVGPSALVREAAGALIGFTDEPQALVTGCRRLVDRHPEAGPMWWLASRVLGAADPAGEARKAAQDLESDPTAAVLADRLPDDLTVVVLGWPEIASAALARRGDVEALVVDVCGLGERLVRRLRSSGVDAVDVPEGRVGSAVSDAGMVLLEAWASGPRGVLCEQGSLAAAGVARLAGVPVWVTAGVGRVLPARLWSSLQARLGSAAGEPWERAWEVVPLEGLDAVARPGGLEDPGSALEGGDWSAPPELLKPVGGWARG